MLQVRRESKLKDVPKRWLTLRSVLWRLHRQTPAVVCQHLRLVLEAPQEAEFDCFDQCKLRIPCLAVAFLCDRFVFSYTMSVAVCLAVMQV